MKISDTLKLVIKSLGLALGIGGENRNVPSSAHAGHTNHPLAGVGRG